VLALVAIPANLMTGWLAAQFSLGFALFISGVFSMLGGFVLIFIYKKLNPLNIE
jgi:hypothetical protein